MRTHIEPTSPHPARTHCTSVPQHTQNCQHSHRCFELVLINAVCLMQKLQCVCRFGLRRPVAWRGLEAGCGSGGRAGTSRSTPARPPRTVVRTSRPARPGWWWAWTLCSGPCRRSGRSSGTAAGCAPAACSRAARNPRRKASSSNRCNRRSETCPRWRTSAARWEPRQPRRRSCSQSRSAGRRPFRWLSARACS